MAGRRGHTESGGRVCLQDGCGRRVRPGEAFCRGHGRTPEAVAFRRELRGVTAHLERVADEDPARAAAALGRLGRRAERGEFGRVGEARRRVEVERTAAGAEVALRVAAAHLAMVRALVEEEDVGRMAGEVVRQARDAARASRERGT